MREITIRQPDDCHLHLRTGEMLKNVLGFSSLVFGRGLVMGNVPLVKDFKNSFKYFGEIISSDRENSGFMPVMTIMLTQDTTPEIIQEAYDFGIRHVKFIAGNTSTGSSEGIAWENLYKYYDVISKIEELEMFFLLHLEVVQLAGSSSEIPYIDREFMAIRCLTMLFEVFPGLRVTVEHVSTALLIGTIKYLKSMGFDIAGTITLHHMITRYDDVFYSDGAIKNPHEFCLPCAKHFEDVLAVRRAAMNGDPTFFFGSDSAPHLVIYKGEKGIRPGIFSAPVLMPALCQLFEKEGCLDNLEDFTSRFGAERYGWKLNEKEVTLVEKPWQVPTQYNEIAPYLAGETVEWQIQK